MDIQSPLPQLLKARFPAKQVDAIYRHFQAMTAQYQSASWEDTIQATGKFIEATMKAIWLHSGNTLPRARKFGVGETILALQRMPASNLDDAIRLTVPRACEFIYDIASNRGARHDPDEVDPNEIDAAIVVAACSWILAEMLRYSQGGAANSLRIAAILSSLSQRRYPQVEVVDGRPYFHIPNLSARKVALLSLWLSYPNRVSKDALFNTVTRHYSPVTHRHFSADDARKAIERLGKVVDDDDSGLKILQPGLAEAEALFGKA
jgi:hypothetical protein